ncbi:MAG: hypothetical protein ACW99F_11970 [Candidatus Hodarchaeales archaeon]
MDSMTCVSTATIKRNTIIQMLIWFLREKPSDGEIKYLIRRVEEYDELGLINGIPITVSL